MRRWYAVVCKNWKSFGASTSKNLLPMKAPAKEIASLARQARYEQAYRVGKRALQNDPGNEAVIGALKEITAALRHRCMDLASNKATEFSPELKEKEALLRKINPLTGEGMYG